MPSGLAAATTSLVTAMSAADGEGSPDGWLCTRISEEAESSSARRTTSRGYSGAWLTVPWLVTSSWISWFLWSR